MGSISNVLSNYMGVMLLIGIIFLFIIFLFTMVIFFNMGKLDMDNLPLAREIHTVEKNIQKDLNDNFVRIINQNDNAYKFLFKDLQESLEKINSTNEKKLTEIREENEKKLSIIETNINEKLDKSLNERLDSSFKTIGEQLQNLQVTNGKLLNMSSTINDLHNTLSNVKVRGVFGERQLENILENILPNNMYERQMKIKRDSNDLVDFAIKIPNREDNGFIYLPIDSKFPNDKYLNIVKASESHDEDALNVAVRELKHAIMDEAKSISEKYIDVPYTTEFAIMFLPTEGLYAEVLRIPELADTCQKNYKVLIAGPTSITAIINSFSVGFKFLQINKNSREIAKALQNIKKQFELFGDEINKAKRSINQASESTEKLAYRNEMITKKLNTFSETNLTIDETTTKTDSKNSIVDDEL